jgi:hypothetical protein
VKGGIVASKLVAETRAGPAISSAQSLLSACLPAFTTSRHNLYPGRDAKNREIRGAKPLLEKELQERKDLHRELIKVPLIRCWNT